MRENQRGNVACTGTLPDGKRIALVFINDARIEIRGDDGAKLRSFATSEFDNAMEAFHSMVKRTAIKKTLHAPSRA